MVTVSRNLRTGRSVWQDRRAPAVTRRRLARDLTTDVLVIGAGITGATVADALSRVGLAVVIVDRRGPAKGSTTASTALVQYEIDTPLTELSRKIGRERAQAAWRRSRLAVDALAGRLAELDPGEVTRRDSLYLAGNVLGRDGLAREHDARRAIGLGSRLLSRRELHATYAIDRPAALIGYGNLAFDPRHVTMLLLRAAAQEGARLFAPVDIVDVRARGRGVTATTADGRRIRCRHLVFATGYEFPHAVPQKGHRITSTWAIATVRQPRRLWPGPCLIWEASDPYLYLRATPDGRIVCGGEDEDIADAAARDALLARKSETIARKLARLMPSVNPAIEFAWAGSFGQTRTGLPIIGPIPHMPNCWAALGYGGNGITYARIAADVIGGAITGKPDADAALYGFPETG